MDAPLLFPGALHYLLGCNRAARGHLIRRSVARTVREVRQEGPVSGGPAQQHRSQMVEIDGPSCTAAGSPLRGGRRRRGGASVMSADPLIQIRGVGTANKGAELMLLAIREHFDKVAPGRVRLAVDPWFGSYED